MGRYAEPYESGRAFIADGMDVKRDADIRESASVARIYGQNLVAAESLTASSGAWGWSPETLKPAAGIEMAMRLNRFVIQRQSSGHSLEKSFPRRRNECVGARRQFA